MKKGGPEPPGGGVPIDGRRDLLSARVEEEVGVEAIEFDHDPSRDGEPDGSEDRGGGEELFHGVFLA
jgi:hypothetical protein